MVMSAAFQLDLDGGESNDEKALTPDVETLVPMAVEPEVQTDPAAPEDTIEGEHEMAETAVAEKPTKPVKPATATDSKAKAKSDAKPSPVRIVKPAAKAAAKPAPKKAVTKPAAKNAAPKVKTPKVDGAITMDSKCTVCKVALKDRVVGERCGDGRYHRYA